MLPPHANPPQSYGSLSLEYVLAVFGTLALQGDPIRWVAVHRKHHAHADREGDSHSIRGGFRWAHLDWLYRRQRRAAVCGRDAPLRTRSLRSAVLLRAPIPQRTAAGRTRRELFALGGWSWVVLGIFVRLVVSYHSTWLVNSASHMLGYRTYQTGDESTNCWWVALISWGEGWHNNHHAFPFSARHGLRWFEIDMTWWHVRLLALLRLADQIKVPTHSMQQQRLRPRVYNLLHVAVVCEPAMSQTMVRAARFPGNPLTQPPGCAPEPHR